MRPNLLATGAALLLFAGLVCAQTAPVDAEAQTPPAAESTSTPAHAASVEPVDIDTIRLFARLFSVVKQTYVDPVSDERLMQAAIQGMLAQLDPHSALLDRKALRELHNDATGEYAGVGIVVADVNGQLQVIAPLDGTPAARAGIRPGDVIVGIDGAPVTSEQVEGMIDALRGPTGSTVILSIVHGGNALPREVTLVRERIHVASVRSRTLAPGFAWLRVSEFQRGTAAELRRAVTALQKPAPLRGVVLDLRSNPGGLLQSAVEVSDLFLDHGGIVSTRGHVAQVDTRFDATAGDILHGAPMVVLVDGGTASAAEIVAGALKDDRRALVMGQRTFGKGSVQSVLEVDSNYAIKLTTARYFTPNGTSIQAEGIVPDISLGELTVNPEATAPTPIVREADLPHHLQNGDASVAPAAAPDSELALDDYALSAALHVLQGLALSRAPAS